MSRRVAAGFRIFRGSFELATLVAVPASCEAVASKRALLARLNCGSWAIEGVGQGESFAMHLCNVAYGNARQVPWLPGSVGGPQRRPLLPNELVALEAQRTTGNSWRGNRVSGARGALVSCELFACRNGRGIGLVGPEAPS